MSQCQRCGATNEPSSRFCVACGAPIAQRSNPAASAPTAPPPPPPPDPAWNQPGASGHPGAVIHPYEGAPPSSSLQFAETAAPPTREEFEAHQAAALAASRRAAASPNPAVAQVAPAAGYAPVAAGVAAYAPGAQPATGAMPGVAQDPELLPEGAPRILAGFFVSYDTQPLGRFWPIFQGKSRIGRQGAAPDLDIELDHPTASSRHALVLAAACPGRLKLEDTGSTNGTLVNGNRLTPGVRHELQDGDRVRFGLLSTIVKIV